jgi:hypothetical protein
MSYATEAARRWPGAAWIAGNGRHATVAHCRAVTVELHDTMADARAALAFIDRIGCGGSCHRRHEIITLPATPECQ